MSILRHSLSKMSRVLSVSILFCIGITLSRPQRVEAGACCASAAAFGVGRLLRWEKFAVGLRSNVLHTLGRWDTKSTWTPNLPTYEDVEWRSELWGMFRIGRPFAAYVRLPWSMNYRKSGEDSHFGGGIGDIQIGGRWDLVPVASGSGWPGIALSLNVLMPTGRKTDTNLSPLATEVTGRGAWMLSSALFIEKSLSPLFFQLQIALNVPLPFFREDLKVQQRFGVGLLSQLAIGWEIVPDIFVASVVIRFSWEDVLEIGGRRIEATHQMDPGVVGALAWRFDPHWTLQVSVNTGIYIDRWGHNVNGRLIYSLGIRYGYF